MRNLTFSLIAVVLVATIGLGWMFDNIYNQYSEGELNEQKDSVAILEQIGQHIATSLNEVQNPEDFIQSWPKNDVYQLKLRSLTKLALPDSLTQSLKSGQTLLLETQDSIDIHFYLARANKLLVLSAPPLQVNHSNELTSFILTSLFYLLMLTLMLLWLMPLLKRLLALRQAAKAFGEGKLAQRVTIGSIAYISDLEIEFNHMAQRIEDLVNDVKLLSSAVSHDLRTPLARIRFGIDTLQEEEDPLLRKRYEQRISDNVDEMVALVETLLRYARLDQTMVKIDKVHFDFSALVTDTIKNKDTQAINIELTANTQPIFVYGDPAYLAILVNNLVQNACQYGRSMVKIEIKQQQESVHLIISDDGEGIEKEQWSEIVKPFTRGKAINNNVKGYGMGLAIVKRIIQWHQGEINIANSSDLAGAEFTIILPSKN